MGKHEPMTAKAIANKIKAKGLQKLKYYCEMCKKQCRDDNGFKCHIQSEAHQRQLIIVSQNPEEFVNTFSQDFMDAFMHILRARYRSKRILANTVFQDLIKDRQHTHLNSTRWTSVTEFAEWLGEKGYVKVDYSERGIMVTYIDRDPETLRRKEIEVKRAEQAKEAAIREQKEIERQREMTRKIYETMEKEKPKAQPIPMVRLTEDGKSEHSNETPNEPTTSKADSGCKPSSENDVVIEKPVFKIQSVSLKTSGSSNFKPPPPKRKVVRNNEAKKKIKS